MKDLYNGFALKRGDDDRNRKYEGRERTPAEIGAGKHIASLRGDLVELGFFLAREKTGESTEMFDRWLEEAVREFQVMARQPTVAHERAEPAGGGNYLRRLASVDVPHDDRYPLSSSSAVDRFASGVVNQTTRRLIAEWKARRWRNPWVIAEWVVPEAPKKPKKTLKTPAPTPAPPVEYKVGPRVLARHDLTVTGRTPRIAGEVFLHDFSDRYFEVDDPSKPDPRFYLGKERSYGLRRGPTGWLGLPDTQEKLIKVTPALLTGEDIADPESAAASTFRVVAALASIEVSHGFQYVNGYDLACLSGGVCHFTLIMPDFKRVRRVHPGELAGLMALMEKTAADEFDTFLGEFGLRPQTAWGDDGRDLLNPVTGIWASFPCRETADAARGQPVDDRSEADVLQSWQWLARFTMLAWVAPAYAACNWDLARMRLRRIGALPIGGTFGKDWTIGTVFSSERLAAKLLRAHVHASSRLAGREAADKPPVCKPWIRTLLDKTLTADEIKQGPAKWKQIVLTRLDLALDKSLKQYADRKDKKGRLIKGDFPRITAWAWRGRPLSNAPRSFQLDTSDL
jgi:hypothetical protein